MLSPDLNLSPVFDTDTVTNVSTQDRQLVEYLSKFGLDESGLPNFKFNPHLLGSTKSQIDRVNLKEIGAQGSKSEAEIKKLFDDKLVIVGDFDGKESNRVARQAIGGERIARQPA